jgi:hypothetical protein
MSYEIIGEEALDDVFSGDTYQVIGDDIIIDHMGEIGAEFGWGFLKSISRAVKSVGKTAANVGKAVIRSPLTKVVTTGLAVVYPPVGIPLAAAVAVADKAISMAESADKTVRDVAKKLIVNTKKQAATGDIGAKRAFTLMQARYAQKKAKAADPVKYNAEAFKREQIARAALQRSNQLDKAPKYGGFIVTKEGRVIPGRQIVKIAGDCR